MESEWDWQLSVSRNLKQKIKSKKEGINDDVWRIWWTIRATRIKRKIK